MLDQLSDTLNFQATALSLRSERQHVIASNIANADTPGYVGRDFNFAQALRQATQAQASGTPGSTSTAALAGNLGALSTHSLAMATTQSGHLGAGGLPANAGGDPSTDMAYTPVVETSLDNNSVDMDRERANFADNTLRYEAALRFINGQVHTLTTAINGQ